MTEQYNEKKSQVNRFDPPPLDHINGNDKDYDGLAPETSGGSGPWETVDKLNSVQLLPGDTVHFRCGGTWYEQIVLEESGTEELPITITSYGDDCAAQPPIIEAGASVNGWQLWGDHIWYADVALEKVQMNRVLNGSNTDGWRTWSENPDSREERLHLIYEGCNGSGSCLEAVADPNYRSLFHAVSISLEEGAQYQLEFDYKSALPDLSFQFDAVVRRNGPGDHDYYQVGFAKKITATGDWQHHSEPFVASETLIKLARVDFELQAGNALFLDNVRLVRSTPEYKVITQVFAGNESLPLAQHPNPRWSPESQTSPFLHIQEVPTDDNMQFTVGEDFDLTAEQITGAGVHIRSNAWTIEDNIVKNFDADTDIVELDEPTGYELKEGWGYYFDNKLWMLDRPGE